LAACFRRFAGEVVTALGVYLPGTKIKTSPTDFAPLEQLQMMKFKGESWELFGPLMSGEKNRRARFSPRHYERSEAIHSFREEAWIASLLRSSQ